MSAKITMKIDELKLSQTLSKKFVKNENGVYHQVPVQKKRDHQFALKGCWFFTYISISYSLNGKNKLEQALYDLLQEHNRLVIPEIAVDNYIELLKHRIREINSQFPKCKQVKPDFYCPENGDIHLYGISTCCFHIYKSKMI